MKTNIEQIFRQINPEGSMSLARRQVFEQGCTVNGQPVENCAEVDVEAGSILTVGKHEFKFDGNTWIRLRQEKLRSKTQYVFVFDAPDEASVHSDPSVPVSSGQSLKIKLQLSSADNLLMIGAQGYGGNTVLDGAGFPVVIEYYKGQFRVLVWADINNEEPTHIISMENARESNRRVAWRNNAHSPQKQG